ncbi:hypothetical protein [Adhaeribacter rhizoryzae]|uniref:Lipocalin-like domain-containing protein n=1 Tax=Adhaeribacter rhizoryzae TaxID=2607907 RepID=A0A5M6DPZ4_9BACT|nr:hypothetical protein [Adhaeribacter rhizoryzae]KAA5549568.1 hypothetical protein F0145_03000 [Adhaeribacter rhizoryzae]
MKRRIELLLFSLMLLSCGRGAVENTAKPVANQLTGTWQLVKAILIEKGDTTVTDYTKNISFIKIINGTHFAFLQHDLNKGKDSAVFVSGGGTYSLKDSAYTEHLEYCSAREWEGNNFNFTLKFSGDTLIQSGVEEVASAGVNRLNIEKYIKVKR